MPVVAFVHPLIVRPSETVLIFLIEGLRLTSTFEQRNGPSSNIYAVDLCSSWVQ